MPLIKFVSMSIEGGKKGVELPDANTIIVRGRLKDHFLYTVESLLGMDTTGYYGELDKQSGAEYSSIDDETYLLFSGDGGIMFKDRSVQTRGVVPNTHVIRYVGADANFRSFYMEQGLSTYSTVYTDMRKFSHVIIDAKWLRLISTVNNLLGFEFVSLSDGALHFSPKSDMPISEDGQKFVYMLMAESYLTPDGYKRVLLLADIPFLDKEAQLKLFKRLSDIAGFGLILTTADLDFTDISEGTSISFLSV